MNMDLEQLQTAVASGRAYKYLLFWGHTQKPGESVGATCLSQWYPIPFAVEGVTYPTAEHWMMAEKARLFEDHAALEKILAAAHPGAAKKLGREVLGFDSDRWDAARFDIVVTGNRHKFAQNPDIKEFLVQSGERILVEASPVDRIWGIGLAADHADAQNPLRWQGLNLLGFALMAVRAEFAGTPET